MRNTSPLFRASVALALGEVAKVRPLTNPERQQLTEAPVDVLLQMSLVRTHNEARREMAAESCKECFSWPCVCSIVRQA